MATNIDLKTKSTNELKVLAYDLSEIIQNYNQVLQTVNTEIQFRKNNPMEQAKQLVKSSEDAKTPDPAADSPS